MRLHGPSPPQGHSSRAQLASLLPPRVQYSPPQGSRGGGDRTFNVMAYTVDWIDDMAWQQRIDLTINPGMVPSTQTDFALLVYDTYPELIGLTKAQIIFADEDNTQLERQITFFDDSTGEIIAYVKKPTVNDGDTIKMYFDNLAAIDEQDINLVWDEHYTSVYHFEVEDYTLDSTVNANDQTSGTSVGTDDAQVGRAASYLGTIGRSFKINPYTSFPSDEITVEFWTKSNNDDETPFSYSIIGGSGAGEFNLEHQLNSSVFINKIETVTSLDFSDNVYHHIVITWKSSNGELLIYDNSVLIDSFLGVATGVTLQNNGSFALGQRQGGTGGFAGATAYAGKIDEFKLSNIVRNQDYITAVFNNQINTGTFYTRSAVQSVPMDHTVMGYSINWYDEAWNKMLEFTVNPGMVPSEQTDFGVVIYGIYPDLDGATPDDIRFTDENNVDLEYELLFELSGGDILAWVKIPALNDGSKIRLYFDNPAATGPTTLNPDVWDADYTSVHHLDGTGDLNDSTGNVPNFSKHNIVSDPDAKLYKAVKFDGTTGSYAIINPYPGWPNQDITCEFWVKTTGLGDGMISYAIGSNNLANEFLIIKQQDLNVTINDDSHNFVHALNDGNWHYVVVKYSIASIHIKLYVDAVFIGQAFQSIVSMDDSGSLVLGQDQDSKGGGFSAGQALDGSLEGLKISKIDRSEDYITTAFNNQNDQSAFFSVGKLQVLSELKSTPMGYTK